jgi:hypothetical protein
VTCVVRLRRRGLAMVALGIATVTVGELVRAGALVALGAMALAATATAAATVHRQWRRWGRTVTVDLAVAHHRVVVGSPVPVWLRLTPAPGDGIAPPLPGTGRVPSGRRHRGHPGRRWPVEVDDPAQHWTVARRHRVVDIAAGRPHHRQRRSEAPERQPMAPQAPGPCSTPHRTPGSRSVVVVVDPVPTAPAAVLTASCRGLLHIGPLAARLVDPLGLAEAALPATDTATVLIGPRWPPPIRPVVPAGGRHGTSGPATSGGRPAPAGDEVLGVAMASPGASVGHLHWPTTVRSGVPMALQFQESADQTGAITIVMDDRAEVHDGSSFEAVVAATAAVGTAVLAEGRPILLRGAVPVRSIGPGRRAAEVLLDHLVLADVTDAGADTGARRLDHALGGRSDAIVVTSRRGAQSLRAASGTCLVVDGASWSMPHVLGAAPATDTSAPHVLA